MKREFRFKKIRFNGDYVKVTVPIKPISWEEFVAEMRPLKKELAKLKI